MRNLDFATQVGSRVLSLQSMHTSEPLPDESQDKTEIRPAMPRPRGHSRSLRSKLVLSLACLLAFVIGIDEYVRQKVITPEFESLETIAALKDANRVMLAIDAELEFMAETATHDLAQYEAQDTFDLPGNSPQDVSHSLQAIANVRPRGDRVEWAALANDAPEESGESLRQQDAGTELESKPLRKASWVWSASGRENNIPPIDCHPLDLEWESAESAKTKTGVVAGADHQLHLFAATPVFGSDKQTVEAYYVIGRRFDDGLIQVLERRTRVPFNILPAPRPSLLYAPEVRASQPGVLTVQTPLIDCAGNPIAELSVVLPREITSRSDQVTAFARYLSLCGILGAILLLLLFLQRTVIGRLEVIREHTERIAAAGFLTDAGDSPVLTRSVRDEIGQLAHSFDRMRLRLGNAQKRIIDASHSAGMSLVADTVIHNVGNVLTNVNSLIDTASQRIDRLRVEPLQRLAVQLQHPSASDELREETPRYLERLSETLADDRRELSELLHTLDDNVRHIHQVIRDQRQHAQMPIRWGRVPIKMVVTDALRCCESKLDPSRIKMTVSGEDDVSAWTDRSLLLQILINLFINAADAIEEGESKRPAIQIESIHQDAQVLIRISDNGCGMTNETLDQVFDARFTTRDTGNGLGLHFCAIAIKRLGGSIRATSRGQGLGATFQLTLPTQADPSIHSDEPAVSSQSQSDPIQENV